MAADIAATLNTWSATEASNQPDNTDSVGPNTLADNLRRIQAVVKANVAGSDTIASASTCDIGSKEASYLAVSGTTTITSLGSTGTAGIVKTLKFDGALTLTHNGTSLILPGAANITTVAGDVGVFRCEGSGNWRCLAYAPTNQDPYIEGTWTPAFTASGSTFAYDTQAGTYEKFGRQFSLSGYIKLSTSGQSFNSSEVTITGLPFTFSSSTAEPVCAVTHSDNAGFSGRTFQLKAVAGTSTLKLFYYTSSMTQGPIACAASQIGATGGLALWFSVTGRTA